jgi:hypothetical protein
VVHLPLSPASRALFNATKAGHWFTTTVEGLNYGFHNMVRQSSVMVSERAGATEEERAMRAQAA